MRVIMYLLNLAEQCNAVKELATTGPARKVQGMHSHTSHNPGFTLRPILGQDCTLAIIHIMKNSILKN